jgi:hypothetical protein
VVVHFVLSYFRYLFRTATCPRCYLCYSLYHYLFAGLWTRLLTFLLLLLVLGSIFGLVCGVSSLLAVASTYEDGLGNFLFNTQQDFSILAGASVSLGSSLAAVIIVSLFTHKIRNKDDVDTEWQKLRDIDNPLHPWALMYTDDFPDLKPGDIPSVERLDSVFRRAQKAAYIGGALTFVVLIGILPGTMLSLNVLDVHEFQTWAYVLHVWCILMAAIVIVATPIEEGMHIYKQYKQNQCVVDDTPSPAETYTGLSNTAYAEQAAST